MDDMVAAKIQIQIPDAKGAKVAQKTQKNPRRNFQSLKSEFVASPIF
jgi:hypothetical protein